MVREERPSSSGTASCRCELTTVVYQGRLAVTIAQRCAVSMPGTLASAAQRNHTDVLAFVVVNRDVTRIRVMWEKYPGIASATRVLYPGEFIYRARERSVPTRSRPMRAASEL